MFSVLPSVGTDMFLVVKKMKYCINVTRKYHKPKFRNEDLKEMMDCFLTFWLC